MSEDGAEETVPRLYSIEGTETVVEVPSSHIIAGIYGTTANHGATNARITTLGFILIDIAASTGL